MDAWKIVQCQRCSLARTEPLPSDEFLAALYQGSYDHEQLRQNLVREGKSDWGWIISEIERHVGGPGRVLEIGCSFGYFLDQARQRGWDAVGLEIAREPLVHARTLGVEVIDQPLQQGMFDRESFDAVCLFHTLEHLSDPLSTLGLVRDTLKDGGVVAITVPNFDSVRSRLMGPAWEWLSPPYHVYHFSPLSLPALTEAAGLEVLDVEVQWWHSQGLGTLALESSWHCPDQCVAAVPPFDKFLSVGTDKEVALDRLGPVGNYLDNLLRPVQDLLAPRFGMQVKLVARKGTQARHGLTANLSGVTHHAPALPAASGQAAAPIRIGAQSMWSSDARQLELRLQNTERRAGDLDIALADAEARAAMADRQLTALREDLVSAHQHTDELLRALVATESRLGLITQSTPYRIWSRTRRAVPVCVRRWLGATS